MPTSFRNLTPYIERHLVSNSTTTLYEWFTPWLSADGVDYIRAVLKAKNATSANFQWQLAIQYAAVRGDSPDNAVPTTLGASQTNSGDYQTGDVAINTAAKRLFRLGIAYVSVVAGVQQADVCLQASWKQVGTDLGTRQVTVNADDNGTKYEPLTPWMPATFMAKIKAAFVLNSTTPAGNLRYQLAYQTAGALVQQPSAWTNAESAWSQPNVSYEERNTGELTLNTSDMWFRLGVAYYQFGLGVDTNIAAVLTASCACR